MFNEIGYGNTQLGSTSECDALKLNCDTRFPPSDDPDVLAGIKRDMNWECMVSTGYTKNCMDNKSYRNPGATLYPLDVLINPDNPDYLLNKLPSLPDLPSGNVLLIAALAIGAVVVFGMMRR